MKLLYWRILSLTTILLMISAIVVIVLWMCTENISFYYTPSQLSKIRDNKLIRVGGIARNIKKSGMDIEFNIADRDDIVRVKYHGVLPPLFKEGGGVVATGIIDNNGYLNAQNLLNKHNEYYMPHFMIDEEESSEYIQ